MCATPPAIAWDRWYRWQYVISERTSRLVPPALTTVGCGRVIECLTVLWGHAHATAQLLKLHFCLHIFFCLHAQSKASAPRLSAAPPRTLRCLNSSTQASSRRGTSTRLAHAPCSRAVSRVHVVTQNDTNVIQGRVQCAIIHMLLCKHNNPRPMPMM